MYQAELFTRARHRILANPNPSDDPFALALRPLPSHHHQHSHAAFANTEEKKISKLTSRDPPLFEART
jgi:hypothetical protein